VSVCQTEQRGLITEICSVTIPSNRIEPHPIYHAGSSCDNEILEDVAVYIFFEDSLEYYTLSDVRIFSLQGFIQMQPKTCYRGVLLQQHILK